MKDGSFTFLNINVKFDSKVDWNYHSKGLLWTYNLCYFDFLLQKDISVDDGLKLMRQFAQEYENITSGLDPYPTSLRIVNWVKFFSIHSVQDDLLDQVLFSDLKRLSDNIEFHLMGNHILENSFSLLFGGIYFQDRTVLDQSEKLLIQQMDEQILPDGAHFELSPMYHQIILTKTLDAINLLINNDLNIIELLPFLRNKAELMLGWLEKLSFRDGSIPHLNDSTYGIAPSTTLLQEYADRLIIKGAQFITFNESGYRKFVNKDYEAIIDVGMIGPDYIPGHAHSDTLNILVNYHQVPVITDTGISTYEKNHTRQKERSTAAHNTVVIEDQEQSEVWGGFRVGRRAKCLILEERENFVHAAHNGYEKIGITHNRSFFFDTHKIIIQDQLNKKCSAKAFFHFHPEIKLQLKGNIVKFNYGTLELNQTANLRIGTYEYTLGFNRTKSAQVLEIGFDQALSTTINFYATN